MKNIKYILSFLCAVIFSSCSDYLDKQPLDELSSSTFWKTEADADKALAGVYGKLQFPLINDLLAIWDGITDNAWGQFAGEFNIDMFWAGTYNATNCIMTRELYTPCYRTIAACNIFLANIDNVDADADLLAQYKGEVKFIRAFMYYWLTQCFGGVCLVTEPLTLDNMKMARSTKAEVLTQIYEDLDYAIANLPDKAYSGHVMKSSAQALKARVKLFNAEYADAAALAKSVMESGLYSLSSDYASLFVSSGNQENNPEIIFSVKFLSPTYNLSNGYIGWYGYADPLKEFVESFESGDTRLSANVLQWGDYWPMAGVIFSNSGEGQGYRFYGYVCKKWVDQTLTPNDDWWSGTNDVPHLRYAEVLLNYAEAENEASGPDQSVYNAVNQVRNRSGLADLPAGLTKDGMREKIRHERRVELCFEGQRYFDLVRWGIAKDIIPKIAYVNDPTVFRVWKDAYTLFPILQTEIDKDPDNLKQNPGY